MKMIMRRFGSVALAALALGAVCFTPAEAAYKPKITSKMGGQFTKDVQKVVTTLKSMPKPARWFFIVEKLGFLFMPPNGEIGNRSETGNMRKGAHFIGIDGMEYDGEAEFKTQPWEKWKYSVENLDRLGRENIFSKLSSEVTALALANAKYHLEKLAEEQPERRDMYLAYLAKLCYLPDGKSPYEKMVTETGPNKQPFQYYSLGGKGCLFVDTEGTEHKYDDVNAKYASLGGDRWTILNVCAYHVGAKDILALYPDEVKKLRANYKKKMQELSDGGTKPKEDKEVEETNEPSEKAGSLAKKLGVTYHPKTNADRMGGQAKKDMDRVLAYLKSLPKTIRWCFIAERMGLLFFPQDGGFGHNKDGWIQTGSHFIGADGLEYDAKSEAYAQPTGAAWGTNTEITDRLGRDLVFSQLPDEVAELVLQNAKYQLDKMAEEHPEGRDAILARLAQLEYLPDGTASYVLKTWKWGRTNVVNEYVLSNPDVYSFHYMDTEGKEQRTGNVYDRTNKGRWAILIICAHHLGADAILALCPEEVKKLRANYEKKMQELGVDTTEAKEDK